MKKTIKIGLSLMLIVAMLVAGASTQAEAATSTTTMPPVKATGSLEGVVVDIEPNDIIINMDNGNTISFMLNYITLTEAVPGDRVKIEYAGDVTDRPEAITITVTQAASLQTINGKVIASDDKSVFVQISSSEAFGFTLNKSTKITGKATSVVKGDTVAMTYSGDLHDAPLALEINVTKAVKNRTEKPEEVPVNKSLDGYVTRLSGSAMTIQTGKGKTYSFKITAYTNVNGDYSLEVGARVTVTYDGYASKKPAAKNIRVVAPPDPTPTPKPPKVRTENGTVNSFYGIYLVLTSGSTFNCSGTSFGGDAYGDPGDLAKVTYYVGDDGVYYATKIVFNTPAPTPPKTRTVTGEVSDFGGMYLSLTSGMGFDVTYASYGGNGDRVPGETAKVTYYVGDDGMNYATYIVFTAVYVQESVPAMQTEPTLAPQVEATLAPQPEPQPEAPPEPPADSGTEPNAEG